MGGGTGAVQWDCCYTVVTLFLHSCQTDVTLLINCCYIVLTLTSASKGRWDRWHAVGLCMHTHTHTHTQLHLHTHTYTYTHMHTHTVTSVSNGRWNRCRAVGLCNNSVTTVPQQFKHSTQQCNNSVTTVSPPHSPLYPVGGGTGAARWGCCYTVVSLLVHCCYTVVTLLSHCSHTVLTLTSVSSGRWNRCRAVGLCMRAKAAPGSPE
jgi:hypothetical protein